MSCHHFNILKSTFSSSLRSNFSQNYLNDTLHAALKHLISFLKRQDVTGTASTTAYIERTVQNQIFARSALMQDIKVGAVFAVNAQGIATVMRKKYVSDFLSRHTYVTDAKI